MTIMNVESHEDASRTYPRSRTAARLCHYTCAECACTHLLHTHLFYTYIHTYTYICEDIPKKPPLSPYLRHCRLPDFQKPNLRSKDLGKLETWSSGHLEDIWRSEIWIFANLESNSFRLESGTSELLLPALPERMDNLRWKLLTQNTLQDRHVHRTCT